MELKWRFFCGIIIIFFTQMKIKHVASDKKNPHLKSHPTKSHWHQPADQPMIWTAGLQQGITYISCECDFEGKENHPKTIHPWFNSWTFDADRLRSRSFRVTHEHPKMGKHKVGPGSIAINGVKWGPYKWPKINGRNWGEINLYL